MIPIIRFHRLLKSFKYAFKGLWYTLCEEQNFRIHLIFTAIVILLAFFFRISTQEFLILIIVITLVLMAELINTIFERIVDILRPRLHPYAEKVKDMMAAVVLVAAISASLVGLLIFLPKVLEFFK